MYNGHSIKTGVEKMTEEKCVICDQSLAANASAGNRAIEWFEGNDPWPLGGGEFGAPGRACDRCNDELVVPARLRGVGVTA